MQILSKELLWADPHSVSPSEQATAKTLLTLTRAQRWDVSRLRQGQKAVSGGIEASL